MAGLTNVISRHRLMRGWVEAAGEPTTNTESWQGGGPRSLDGWHAALEGARGLSACGFSIKTAYDMVVVYIHISVYI